MATSAPARSGGSSSITETPIALTPATTPASRPVDLLPADATAATIAQRFVRDAARQSRTMAVPIRPVAPISATLVTYAPVHDSAATVCRSARTHARLAPMIRIGILGAARIAPRGIVTPANALLGAEVVAIATRDLERARGFRQTALDSHGPR